MEAVLIALNQARDAVASMRSNERDEVQRRLAILNTQLELVTAFAEYVHHCIPVQPPAVPTGDGA